MVFCVMIWWVNGQKYENLLQFNTRWLASPRTWYSFRLCFSFSYSAYDLTLIKKSHTLNCYSFYKSCFPKQKLTNLLLATVVGRCLTKTTNSGKNCLLFVTYVLFNNQSLTCYSLSLRPWVQIRPFPSST